MFVSCCTLAADDSKSGAGDDFDEVADGVGGQASKELVRVEKVLVDADFTGNCIVGLTNGMGPSGEKGAGATNTVVPVGFPNTNMPSFCAAGVIPVPSLLVCRHVFDNEAARAVFTSPTVIPSDSVGS